VVVRMAGGVESEAVSPEAEGVGAGRRQAAPIDVGVEANAPIFRDGG